MGQLIKLQDYVSRYEQDIYRYPTQYVHLKKQQWAKVHNAFQSGMLHEVYEEPEVEEWIPEKVGLLTKIKNTIRKKEIEIEVDEEKDTKHQNQDAWHFTIPVIPKNIDELKLAFLEQLFQSQMKWATSTIRERSFVDYSYYEDERLKFLLQRFPDTFLVMYKPVFQLKKASIEAETIILTPTAAWCVDFLETDDDTVFVGNQEKFWMMRHHQSGEKKILNPCIGLQRTEWIMKQIFSIYDVELPIKKAIISRNGYFDAAGLYDCSLFDKKTFPAWFQSMRRLSSPLKRQQLKASEALLDYSLTTSTMRMMWNEPINSNSVE